MQYYFTYTAFWYILSWSLYCSWNQYTVSQIWWFTVLTDKNVSIKNKRKWICNELWKKVRFYNRFVTTSVFFTMTVVQQMHSNKQTNKLYCVFIICSDKRSVRFASKPTVIPLIHFRKLIVIKIKCVVWINSKPFLVPPKVLHKLYYFPTHRSEITFTKSVRPKSHTSELAWVCGFPWRVLWRGGAPLTPADYFTFQGNAITAEWVQTFRFSPNVACTRILSLH